MTIKSSEQPFRREAMILARQWSISRDLLFQTDPSFTSQLPSERVYQRSFSFRINTVVCVAFFSFLHVSLSSFPVSVEYYMIVSVECLFSSHNSFSHTNTGDWSKPWTLHFETQSRGSFYKLHLRCRYSSAAKTWEAKGSAEHWQ